MMLTPGFSTTSNGRKIMYSLIPIDQGKETCHALLITLQGSLVIGDWGLGVVKLQEAVKELYKTHNGKNLEKSLFTSPDDYREYLNQSG